MKVNLSEKKFKGFIHMCDLKVAKRMGLGMKRQTLFNENEYVFYRVLQCVYNCMYSLLSKNVITKVETLLKESIEICE